MNGSPSRWLVALLVALVVAAGCSSDGDRAAAEGFCDAANSFITSSDARLVTTPDAALFESLDNRLNTVGSLAPGALDEDLDLLRSGLASIGDVYAEVGFDPDATVTLPTEVLAGNAGAARQLETHLEQNCGLDQVRNAQVAQIVEAFTIDDREVAECLHVQLGDVANIASSDLTPSLLLSPVCGTSLFRLLGGDASSGS